MQTLILTANVDPGCAQKIAGRFPPPRFKVHRVKGTDGLCEQIVEKQPKIVLLGTHGHAIEEGLSLVRRIRSVNPGLPIITVNKHSCESRAIAALKAGVNDYYKIPFAYSDLFSGIDNLISDNLLPSESSAPSSVRQSVMIGESAPMQRIINDLHRVAQTRSTVLITGETGTGKELAAGMIHRHSHRRRKPFVCVNCAALPENLCESELFGYKRGAFTGAVGERKGKIELSSGGTLFLDEIGDMSLVSQAKILRSIENHEVYPLGAQKAKRVDLRVIAATNRDPEKLLGTGKFRADLYYRINVARIHMPPLRERKDDISNLIGMGIRQLNRQFKKRIEGLSMEAMASLYQYHWPGNVRELNNVLEAAFISCVSKTIEFGDLPLTFKSRLTFVDGTSTDERSRLLVALWASNWNKSEAAARLRWSRMRVYRALKRYNISSARQPLPKCPAHTG